MLLSSITGDMTSKELMGMLLGDTVLHSIPSTLHSPFIECQELQLPYTAPVPVPGIA